MVRKRSLDSVPNGHPVLTQSHPGYLDSFKKHMDLWLPQVLWDHHLNVFIMVFWPFMHGWLTTYGKLMSCQYLNLYLPTRILINEMILYCLHRSCLLSLLYQHRKYFLWLKRLFIHLSTWRNFEQGSRPMAKFCGFCFFFLSSGISVFILTWIYCRILFIFRKLYPVI